MSQKKVDAYKAQKANREKIMKKEKAVLRLEKLAAAVVCVVAVCWLGYSVYDKIVSVQDTVVTETVMDVTALDDYLTDLSLQLEDAEEDEADTEAAEVSDEDGADVSEETEEDASEESQESADSDEDGADVSEDTEEDAQENSGSDEDSADASGEAEESAAEESQENSDSEDAGADVSEEN